MSHYLLEVSPTVTDFLGQFGVSFFFVLSGFLLTLHYSDHIEKNEFSTRRFVLSRLLKFYPLHLVCFLIMAVLDYRVGNGRAWYEALTHVLLIQSWFPSDYIQHWANVPSWFLSDLLFCYLIFKMAYKLICRINPKYWIFIGGVSYIAYLWYTWDCIPQEDSICFAYIFPPFRAIDFCVGIAIGKSFQDPLTKLMLTNPETRWHLTFQTLLAGMLICIIGLYPLIPATVHVAALFLIFMPLFIYMMALSDRANIWTTRFLHFHWLQRYSNICFELYLVHWPVYRIINSLTIRVFEYSSSLQWMIALVSLVISLPAAYLAKKYVRLPYHMKKC